MGIAIVTLYFGSRSTTSRQALRTTS